MAGIDNRGSLEPVWPLRGSDVPSDIPTLIRSLFSEAKRAHAVQADTAALLAARTALIRMLRQQGVSNLGQLVDRGKITRVVAGQANEVRLWANVTGHEDVPEGVPTPEEVEELIEYLGLVLDAVYVQPARLERLTEKRNTRREAS